MASELGDEQLPSLFRAADEASLLAQRDASRWTGGRLVLLLAAAVAGAIAWHPAGGTIDALALAAAVGFFLALLLEVRLGVENPEQRWYQGRAAAESVKTLAWRYAVGGYPLEIGRPDADEVYLGRLEQIVLRLHALDLAPAGTPEQITSQMRALRGQNFEERRAVYTRDRVDDQYHWYSSKSRRNREIATRWSVVVYVATGLGFAGALVKAVGLMTEVDLLGVASALVASVTAWTQLRQHRALAEAYAVTAAEVSLVRTRISAATDEQDWAEAVSAAEEAFSREHTLWLARRAATP